MYVCVNVYKGKARIYSFYCYMNRYSLVKIMTSPKFGE